MGLNLIEEQSRLFIPADLGVQWALRGYEVGC